MKKISQEDVMNMSFTLALNKEELLMKKYNLYFGQTKNKEIKSLLKELNKESKEHVKLMMELMSSLNIQITGKVIK